jgi:hypothetical protein
VLQLLKEKQLYAKPSKCFFGVKEVEYLGHIVSHEGVKVDPNKTKAMMDWSIPKTLKNLRGFLGLTGYYRKFVRHYGRISTHLMELTKKDAFSYTPEATKDFKQLKEVMCVRKIGPRSNKIKQMQKQKTQKTHNTRETQIYVVHPVWATSTREIARSFLYYYPANEGIQPTAKPAVTSSSFSHRLLSQNTIFTLIHSRNTFPS